MKDKTGKKRIKKFGIFMQTNLLFVFGAIIVLFLILIGRLLYLNYSVGDKYEKRVLSQQTYVSNAIAYKRGSILDRNQTVLAQSIRVYNLILDPKKLLSKEEYQKPTLKALEKSFGIKAEEIEEILEKKPTSQYVVFQKSIEADKVKTFKKMQDKDKNIQGIWFEEDYKRVYPYNTLACDVVGFTTSGMSTGIESYYNDELTGEDGREYGYFDSDLNLQRTVKDAVNGNTIVTTLDAQIQSIVEKKVAEFNKSTGSNNTAVLVTNPQTAEIYAMTSGEQYDLNNPKDLTGFYTEKQLAKMDEQAKLDALNQIWRNFVVSDMFEPGSTYKPITVASALEEGVVKKSTKFYCPGYHMVAGVKIRCASRVGHGTVSLGESLMYSCNAALMQIGEKLGVKKFYKEQQNFMFGSKTGIDLPAETTGYLFNEEQLGPTELATSTFGQGFKCSMLQIAAANSSLVNGGNYIEPHILKEINSSTGALIESKEPVVIKKTVSEDTSELIRQYLLDTVNDGTATVAQIDGYAIGGKTGTAEKYPRGNGKYLVSFIGFAPMDNPQVMIYVVIDEPHVADQAHSTYATQLFHDIAEEIFPFLDIPKSKTKAEKAVEKKKKKEAAAQSKKQEEEKKSNKTENGVTPEGEVNKTVGDEAGAKQDAELPSVKQNMERQEEDTQNSGENGQ